MNYIIIIYQYLYYLHYHYINYYYICSNKIVEAGILFDQFLSLITALYTSPFVFDTTFSQTIG